MAKYLTTDTELTDIANAIRNKTGTTGSLVYPIQFLYAIESIEPITLSVSSASVSKISGTTEDYLMTMS